MRTGEVSDGRPPWALLVYMVSDEPSRDVEVVDLDRVLAAERRALIAASAATGVPVAIQADYLAPHKTVQYFGLPDEAPQVGVLSNVNSTDPVEIQAFLKRAHQKFNAENYVVMFWGHSSGPSGLFSDERPLLGITGVGTTETLDLPSIRKSLSTLGDKVKVALFKDCFQSLLETAFELAPWKGQPRSADYLIASQGLIPVATVGDKNGGPQYLDPWPYDRLLDCLAGKPEAVVPKLVKQLGAFYEKKANRASHIDVPVAALDLNRVAGLVEPLRQLGERLVKGLDDPAEVDLVEDAFRRAFRGVVDGDPLLVDVHSLCDRLIEMGDDTLSVPAKAVQAQVDQLVSIRRPANSAYRGVSAYYYPPTPAERQGTSIGLVLASAYTQLRLNKKTRWHEVALAATPSAIARRRFQ